MIMKITSISITALLMSNSLLWVNANTNKTEEVIPLPDRVDMSIKPGNVRNISELNLFSPIIQSKNHVKFLSLMAKGDTKDSNEINLGYGQRTIKNDNHIVGYYGYFDARKTKYNNVYTQITVGAEYLSDPIDVRVNGYVPIDKYHHIPQEVSVVQAGGTLNIAHANREYALGGWDFEVGTQYKFNEHNSFHVYGGRFEFRNRNTRTIKGNRYRSEVRFDNLGKYFPKNSRFTWGYETQKDKVRGKVRYNMFRLSIPLYTPQERPEQITGLRRRLIDPIIRDVDIVAATNVKQEQAFFMDKDGNKTNKKAAGIKRVSTGADLYRATTLGKEGDIIIVEKDITTSLEMKLKKNQHLTSSGKKIQLTTPSGIKIDYTPVSGTTKTVTNTLPNGHAFKSAEGSTASGINLKKTVYKNDPTATYNAGDTEIKDVLVAVPEFVTAVLKPGDANSYFKVSALNPQNKSLTYTLKCYNLDRSEKANCNSDATVTNDGKIKLVSGTDVALVKLIVSDADGNSDKSDYSLLFSPKGLSDAKENFYSKDILPNPMLTVKGVKLQYGNDYKCSADTGTADSSGNCTASGKTKIKEVQDIINGLLSAKNPNSAKIIAQLKKHKAMMTLFNTESNRDSLKSIYRNYLPNNQDLQAAETFVNSQGNKGTNAANDERSAALEEIVHLIHNYGISKALPEWQERLDKATQAAYAAGKLKWMSDPDDDLPRRDLDDEYFADGVEAYFNMRGGLGVTKGTHTVGSDDKRGICGTSASVTGAGKDCATLMDCLPTLQQVRW